MNNIRHDVIIAVWIGWSSTLSKIHGLIYSKPVMIMASSPAWSLLV